MPDESKTTSEAKAADEPRITRERLIEESYDFVGHPSHIVAGALASESKKEFTVSEVKSKVQKWLKAPVANDQAEEE